MEPGRGSRTNKGQTAVGCKCGGVEEGRDRRSRGRGHPGAPGDKAQVLSPVSHSGGVSAAGGIDIINLFLTTSSTRKKVRIFIGARVLIGRPLPPPSRSGGGPTAAAPPRVIHSDQATARRLRAVNERGSVCVCRVGDRVVVATTIVEESGAREEAWLAPALADLKRSAAIRRWLQQQQHHNKLNNNNNNSPPDKMPMLLQHPPPHRPLDSEPQPLDFSVKQYNLHPRRHNLFLHSSNSETSEDEGVGPPPDSPLRGDTSGE
ncbi:hypothetical protein J6590_048577 [Homalodisca vitripennis]|nr:hypothetical protein J6590_048577 [Homalodisca vitripennis]